MLLLLSPSSSFMALPNPILVQFIFSHRYYYHCLCSEAVDSYSVRILCTITSFAVSVATTAALDVSRSCSSNNENKRLSFSLGPWFDSPRVNVPSLASQKMNRVFCWKGKPHTPSKAVWSVFCMMDIFFAENKNNFCREKRALEVLMQLDGWWHFYFLF